MDYDSLIQTLCISVLPVLFAITVHEVAHGWVASLFGDQTARLAGRLTLNPAKHIDVVGTIIVPLLLLFLGGFIFGWAKPVPVDARNLKNPRWNMIFVAAAGPSANLLMAIAWGALAKLGSMYVVSNAWGAEALYQMGLVGIQINIFLAILNCLPIPPLDGGRILMNCLPGRIAYRLIGLETYSFFILTLLLLTGLLQKIMGPPAIALIESVMRLFNLS